MEMSDLPIATKSDIRYLKRIASGANWGGLPAVRLANFIRRKLVTVTEDGEFKVNPYTLGVVPPPADYQGKRILGGGFSVLGEINPAAVLQAEWPKTRRSSDRILPFVIEGKEYFVRWSIRYPQFHQSSVCAACGLTGTRMLLGRNGNDLKARPHFNFYAETDDALVLMTRDHIVPLSKGGKDNLLNLQTLCTLCNGVKGDKEMNLETLRARHSVTQRRGVVQSGPTSDIARVKVVVTVEIDRNVPLFGTRLDDRTNVPDYKLGRIVAENVRSMVGDEGYKANGFNLVSVAAESTESQSS
jgi:hypothetical protein